MPCKKFSPETMRKPSCVRRLDFGPDPPGESVRNHNLTLQNMLELERRRAMERWNFDFENEVPLEGQWQWESTLVPLHPPQEVLASRSETQPIQVDEESLSQPEH